MIFVKFLVISLAAIAMFAAAFEFSDSNSTFDFTQTTQIFIVDDSSSKFFGMFDPFEMRVTTIPSRFYISVMGAIARGHENADGVVTFDGPAQGHSYSVIFRSLDNAHVLYVGTNWIVDGNKMILLTPEEVVAIYEQLKTSSDRTEPTDLSQLDGLFDEIDRQMRTKNPVGIEREVASIAEATVSIQERLPDGYDDTKTLPHYNKWMENQKFYEEEKARKLKDIEEAKKVSEAEEAKTSPAIVTAQALGILRVNSQAIEKEASRDQVPVAAKGSNNTFIFLSLSVLVALSLLFYWKKARSR